MFKLKSSQLSQRQRLILKKIKPFYVSARLSCLRVRGLFFKGTYRKYSRKDPDFSLLNCKIIFIVAMARSGTTALYELLNSCPKVYAYNEILNPDAYFNFYDFLDSCSAVGLRVSRPSERERLFKWYLFNLAKKNDGIDYVTFDLKIENAQGLSKAWEEPIWNPNIFNIIRSEKIGVIHLVRENYLRRMVSSVRSSETGLWHEYSSGKKDKRSKIYIDINGMVDKFEIIRSAHNHIKKLFSVDSSYLRITYESMFELKNNETIFADDFLNNLSSYFKIENSFNVLPSTKKIGGKELQEEIANFEEVEQALKKSDFFNFLTS